MHYKNLFRFSIVVLSFILFLQSVAMAQQKCQPPALNVGVEPNIFSDEQEVALGDIVAEHSLTELKVVEDAELTAYLNRIGERLLKHAPQTKLRFQFAIVDIDDANAFSFPGGRVYVSRKLIALMKTEDELASIIGHEIGHLIGHDSAEGMTRYFREVLGVTQVGDKRDIFEKFNRLIESTGLKSGAFRNDKKHDGNQEIAADSTGFYLFVSAGYMPQAMQEAFDRLTENKGKKGSWLSDLFGTTSINSKRFREMEKKADAISRDCIDRPRPEQAEEFKKWQTAVVNFTGLGAKTESLHNVISKYVLEPHLQGEIVHLKFSPDGKYLLAQDDGGISIITKQPFQLYFRIDTVDADKAEFTPDSQNVIFSTSNLRIESWSISEKKIAEAKELYFQGSCLKKELSPDGKTLACLDESFGLKLFDVASNNLLLDKKDFYKMSYYEALRFLFFTWSGSDIGGYGDLIPVNMKFSPDSRIFAAGHGKYDSYGSKKTDTIAFDIQARKTIQLGDKMKNILSGGFVFLSADKVIGSDIFDPSYAGIAAFPKGDIITNITFHSRRISLPTRGNYLIFHDLRGENPLAVKDLSTNKLIKGYWKEAFDIYDDVFAGERIIGELNLMRFVDNSVVAKLNPPKMPLAGLRAITVSPDFNTLAISRKSRGAVWSLNKKEQIFNLRGFSGAYFSDNGDFYADFPEDQTMKRTMGAFNLASKKAISSSPIADNNIRQYGQYLIRYYFATDARDNSSGYKIEVKDTQTQNVLWDKKLKKEMPRFWVNPESKTVVFQWGLKTDYMKEEAKKDPALSQQLAALNEKEGDYFLQVFDASNGNQLGRLFIETGKGSFRIRYVFASGNWVIVSDSQNRILVYSLSDGKLLGRAFGDRVAVAKESNLVSIENRAGQLEIYELPSMQKRDELTFTSRISLARFSKDGKKLFALTANQEAYIIDVSTLTAAN